jgi:hypothetical protein
MPNKEIAVLEKELERLRDNDGYWQQIESYISEHSDAKFSHGLCPECMIKLYGKDFTLGKNME